VTQASERLYKARDGRKPNKVHDGYVIYDEASARVTFLNPTAAAVLELCHGGAALEAITEAMREAFHLPEAPRSDVAACLESLLQLGLVEIVPQRSQ